MEAASRWWRAHPYRSRRVRRHRPFSVAAALRLPPRRSLSRAGRMLLVWLRSPPRWPSASPLLGPPPRLVCVCRPPRRLRSLSARLQANLLPMAMAMQPLHRLRRLLRAPRQPTTTTTASSLHAPRGMVHRGSATRTLCFVEGGRRQSHGMASYGRCRLEAVAVEVEEAVVMGAVRSRRRLFGRCRLAQEEEEASCQRTSPARRLLYRQTPRRPPLSMGRHQRRGPNRRRYAPSLPNRAWAAGCIRRRGARERGEMGCVCAVMDRIASLTECY